jgi:iron complex transport system substrate-binding protein
MFTLLVSGCRGTKQTPESAAPVKKLTIVDTAGRTVELPANIERVACIYAVTGHITAMLGKSDKIVAVADGLKRDVLLTGMYPHLKEAAVPSVGGVINVEELLKTNPDVTFISGMTGQSEGEVAKLQKSNIPYIVIDFRTIKEQQAAIELIGTVVGAADKAARYNAYYQACIERVQGKVKNIPDAQRIKVYHSVNEATRTGELNSLSADCLRVAGADNVALSKDHQPTADNKYNASIEQIVLWDPDIILVNEAATQDVFLQNKQWSGLKAVQERKVYLLPSGVSRWGHPGALETPLAVLWTAKTLYPALFAEIDMVAETKQFYQEFFDYKLTDAEIEKILSGRGMIVKKGEKR